MGQAGPQNFLLKKATRADAGGGGSGREGALALISVSNPTFRLQITIDCRCITSYFEWEVLLPLSSLTRASCIIFGMEHRKAEDRRHQFYSSTTTTWQDTILSVTIDDESLCAMLPRVSECHLGRYEHYSSLNLPNHPEQWSFSIIAAPHMCVRVVITFRDSSRASLTASSLHAC